MQHKTNKFLSLTFLILWGIYLMFIIVDSGTQILPKNLEVAQVLEESSFARGMFLDIGILSTIFAGWIAFFTKEKLRYLFAIATLFIGSLAILPFLSIYFYNKHKQSL